MDLIDLREFLHSETGRKLMRYLLDFMVETSAKSNSNAEWIKGMGMMLDYLKKTDEKCRELCETNRR